MPGSPGTVEERPDRLPPVADDLGVPERDDAEGQPGQRHRERAGQPGSREEGRARAQGEEEPGRDHPAQDAQPRVEPDLPRARQHELRHLEDGVMPEARPAQQGGRGRGDGERREGLEGKAAEDDLHREERGPEGRVVGARETGRDAAADEHPQLAWRDPEVLAEPRGRGGGHEHDRPLATDRPGRGLGHDRGRRAHDRRAPGQDAVAQHDRLEDVPAARGARPTRAEGEHRAGDEAAQRGDGDAAERGREGHALCQVRARPQQARRFRRRPPQEGGRRPRDQANRQRAQEQARRLRVGPHRPHGPSRRGPSRTPCRFGRPRPAVVILRRAAAPRLP